MVNNLVLLTGHDTTEVKSGGHIEGDFSDIHFGTHNTILHILLL